MKQERRIKYTQAALKQALLDILQDRPIERVSVKEICERADINRSTFYVHYASPTALLDSIKNELYDDMKAAKIGFEDMTKFLTGVFEVMYRHRQLLMLLSRTNAHMDIIFRIIDLWKDDFMQAMERNGIPRDRAEIAYFYVSFGTCSVVSIWVMGGFKKSSAQIAAEIKGLIDNGLNMYWKGENDDE